MLVLTRKLGETIRIDGKIGITVMEVDGKTVKLGIDAPRSITIHREEVWLRILEENKSAATADLGDVDLGSMAHLFKLGIPPTPPPPRATPPTQTDDAPTG